MDMIRVLLADDEPLIRAGLSTILQASGHITVVGEASTGQQAVTEAQRLHPDVICMDIRMPDGDGLEATRLIQQLNPTPAVIVITTFDLDEYVFGALVEGVQRAALGEGLVDAALTRRVITELTRRKMTITPDTSTLTPRELDCVVQLCRGLSNNDIASELYLEPSTVKTHLSSAMSKTGAENRVQLVIWAFKNNIVS